MLYTNYMSRETIFLQTKSALDWLPAEIMVETPPSPLHVHVGRT